MKVNLYRRTPRYRHRPAWATTSREVLSALVGRKRRVYSIEASPSAYKHCLYFCCYMLSELQYWLTSVGVSLCTTCVRTHHNSDNRLCAFIYLAWRQSTPGSDVCGRPCACSGPGISVRTAVNRIFGALSEIGHLARGLHRVNPLALRQGLVIWRSRLHIR